MAGIPFGKYQLVKRLARGGMAEVFLARQSGPEGFHRLVALKRILPHLVDSQDFVRMFLDEARLAAQLSHPNVVHIYDFGKVDEHFFIAMEFVSSVHAGTLIKRAEKERLPDVLVARIGADACAGLHYAHELRDVEDRELELVHRDVSPPNLLVSYDGAVKLVDFGIAKAVSSIEQTRPGVVKGKFAYMSPEQTIGQKLDGRSDVFSLSIVLWELLAGKVMIPRTDPVDGMRMLRDGRFPPIEKLRPDLAPGLATAIASGLQVKRDQRATALELGRALEGYIKAEPDGIGSSLELAQWVRDRFPRENLSGSFPVLRDEPQGTRLATSATRASPDTGDLRATPRAATATVAGSIGEAPPVSSLPRNRHASLRGDPGGAAEDPEDRDPADDLMLNGPPTRSRPALGQSTTGRAISSAAHLLATPPARKSPRWPTPAPVPAPSDHPTLWGSPRGRAATGGPAGVAVAPHAEVRPTSVIIDDEWMAEEDTGPGADTLRSDRRDTVAMANPPGGAGADLDDDDLGVEIDDNDPAFSPTEVTDQDLTKVVALRAPVPAETSGPNPLTGTELARRPAWRRGQVALLAAAGAAAGLFGALMLSSGGSNATSPGDGGASDLPDAGGPPDASGTAPDPGDGERSAPPPGEQPVLLPPPDAAPAAPTTAVLDVLTRPPGAKVMVGDLPPARSPAHFKEVPAGTYDIRVERNGYQILARSVDLVGGEHRTVDVALDPIRSRPDRKRASDRRPSPADGILKIRTRPYSSVFLGSRRLGQTPLVVDLKPGSYHLTFKHPGRAPIKRRVVVKPSATTKLDFEL